VLPQCPVLSFLILNGNEIGDDGAGILGRSAVAEPSAFYPLKTIKLEMREQGSVNCVLEAIKSEPR
jgi:hypothetical protein